MPGLMALALAANAEVIHSYADAAMFWRRCDLSWPDIERYGPRAYHDYLLTLGTAATK